MYLLVLKCCWSPVRIIKPCKVLIAPILEELFNGCILKEIYPTVLKTAKVIPIYKDGDKSCPSNYCPISLLPHFSKIFERILQIDLTKFLTKHQIISKCQYGFQENLSTTDALIDMCIHLQNQKAQKNIISGIFIDLKKAFDTVDHEILLRKLAHFGLRGTPLKLFSDDLTNRFQFCSVNLIKSNSRLMTCGVPQGSVLGPILFLIFINDLPKMANLKTILFADYTALFGSDSNVSSLEKLVNDELEKVKLWLTQNKLTLNVKKSCHIIFGRKDFSLNLEINNEKLTQKDATKYLGVQIDNHLNWKLQIEHIMTSLAKASGVLHRLKKYVSRDILLMVFHAFVKNKWQYGIILWASANKSTLNRLNKLHNKTICSVTGLPYKTSINKLYDNAGVLMINDLFRLNLAQFMFKLHHKISSNKAQVENITLVTALHNHHTRQAKNKNYFLSNTLTSQCFNGLLVNGSKVWNELRNRKIPSNLKLGHLNSVD